MGILIDRSTRVLVQGITGREGSLRARYMKDYGTHVVAGTSPGKGGSEVHGVPVYDTVAAALAVEGRVDFSVTFVPGRALLPAIEEAADAGVPILVACVESVPIQDIMVMVEYCRDRGTRLIGRIAVLQLRYRLTVYRCHPQTRLRESDSLVDGRA